MKSSTLNTLLVAKSIFGKTKALVSSGDKYSCTAGIILLQDFVELIVLAVLEELDKNEQRNLESKSFDELLGELKRLSVPVMKSGTIKALNKQRVISKHYGQLSEPASIVTYFNAAVLFADALLEHVVGLKLQEIFLTDLLKEGTEKKFIKDAISITSNGEYLQALALLRKAFFLSYEREYCIYDFKDRLSMGPIGLLDMGSRGFKAHLFTKNKQWIEANVKVPADYIQIDHEKLKTDCMEWGVSTVDVNNFMRLTPAVVETEKDVWHLDYDTNFAANELNAENFNYCLDVILDFILKKQVFDDAHKWPKRVKSIPAPPIYIGKPVFERPSSTSAVVSCVEQDYYYTVERVVSGFDIGEEYLYVHLYPKGEEFSFAGHVFGYLLMD